MVHLQLPACACAGPALAREKVAEFQASGFLFKDTVEVNALDDPEGVPQQSPSPVTDNNC